MGFAFTPDAIGVLATDGDGQSDRRMAGGARQRPSVRIPDSQSPWLRRARSTVAVLTPGLPKEVHAHHRRPDRLLGPLRRRRYHRDRRGRPERRLRLDPIPGHGPQHELLGEPRTALELGCGQGDAVAALATTGVTATGIDLSPVHISDAHDRWGHLANAAYVVGDAAELLIDTGQSWDAIYSIWGALWFTDPDKLLPLVHDRLAEDGRLVFSHAPAVPGSYGVQDMYGYGFTGRQVLIHRWAYEPAGWEAVLHRHGFVDIDARIVAAPRDGHVGTLLVQARRGGIRS